MSLRENKNDCIDSETKHGSFILFVLSIFITFALLYSPLCSLLAKLTHSSAVKLMIDTEAEQQSMKVIDSLSMDDYIRATKKLIRAVEFQPRSAEYLRELASVYSLLGTWAKTMDSLGIELPPNAIQSNDALQSSLALLTKAIERQPANPDNHLLLVNTLKLSESRTTDITTALSRAIVAYPGNAPLRYEVARHYLSIDMNKEALKHARVLAALDESYRVHYKRKRVEWVEGLNHYVIQRYYKSYLFAAFELAWRASGDVNIVADIMPTNDDAEEVFQLFLDWRGLRVSG